MTTPLTQKLEFSVSVLLDVELLKDGLTRWEAKLYKKPVGQIHLTDRGKFKVKLFLQSGGTKWLSSSGFMDLHPFDSFDEAVAKLQERALNEWNVSTENV